MGRNSEKRTRIDLGGPAGGLSSNPFASLARRSASPSKPEASAQESASVELSDSGVVEVRFERKGRGGKEVTIAQWLSGAPSDDVLHELARDCAKALGAGVRGGDGCLLIQGRQVERVAAYLADQRGVTVKRGNT